MMQDLGDIVLFLKLESEASFGSPVWRLGRVEEVEYSLDRVIRTVVISYKNDGENIFRRTRRSARKIAVPTTKVILSLLRSSTRLLRLLVSSSS